MHILFTVNSAWNVWNFRMPIINALICDGHDVTVLAPIDDCVSDLESAGCRFIPQSIDVKGLNPFDGIKWMLKFKKVRLQERPDIVLSYTIKNNIFGAIASKVCKIPFIPNVTGLGTAFISGGLLQKVAELLYKKAFAFLPCVFFQNIDDLDLFLERRLVQAKQAHLLPGSGIDLTKFAPVEYPSELAGVVFLMISRVLSDKGIFEYVEAARIVKAKWPHARFQLLGSIEATNRSAIDKEIVQSWQEEGIIEYLGKVNDVRPYISSSHIVVLPSYREGAPRALIEASAMARPILATNVPGCRMIVDDGHTGLLCEARSSESLAKRCFDFLRLSHNEKFIMGTAGRIKMEACFDQKHVVKAYRDQIRSAVLN
jgi:glycosyltransferase involved in cell wall biosynthesis